MDLFGVISWLFVVAAKANHELARNKKRDDTKKRKQRTDQRDSQTLLVINAGIIILTTMSLEFAVQYPCVLRARYSEKHLREWGRLSNLHTRLTTGDTAAPTPEKLRWVENAGQQMELVQDETVVCSTCPACLPGDDAVAGEGEAVGCLGRITYPIEASFEKFLADRVQLALDTVDSEDQPRLLRILIDPESPFDGEATKELRRVTTPEGLRFFELRVPIRLSRAAGQLTTDNVFDLLAGFRSENAAETPTSASFHFKPPPTITIFSI